MRSVPWFAHVVATAGVAVLATASPAGAVTDPPGHVAAATSCAGTLVESGPIRRGTTTLATLQVYWDGTYNCARTVSSSSTWRVARPMGVRIASCPLSDKGISNCHWIDNAEDFGTYRYYAEPSKVNGLGKCITALGYVTWSGVQNTASTSPWVGHC